MNARGVLAFLRRVKAFCLDLLFPRAACCLCCGHPRLASEKDCLCDACREKLKSFRIPAQACERCLSPVEKGRPCTFCHSPAMKPVERVYSRYIYGGEVRQLIHQLKFNACEDALPLLAVPMADSLKRRDFDCLVPVPLHPRRLRQRGFNQTLLLCQAVSAESGLPVAELLRRVRYHRPQSLTSRRDRSKNVLGAFVSSGQIEGLRILLVDDVRTTGSTARACAEALLSAGAASVSLLTAAVVYRRK